MWCMYILSMYVYSKSICECIYVFWICSWVAIGWCSTSMSQCLVVSENASGGNHAVAQHGTWVSPSLVVDKALRGSSCCVVFQRKIDWGCPEKGGFKNYYFLPITWNILENQWCIANCDIWMCPKHLDFTMTQEIPCDWRYQRKRGVTRAFGASMFPGIFPEKPPGFERETFLPGDKLLCKPSSILG